MKPYESLLAVAKFYLGPAAESFLARQCQLVLKIEAPLIAKAQFKDLAHAVEVSAVRFLDRAKADEMAKRIAALSIRSRMIELRQAQPCAWTAA